MRSARILVALVAMGCLSQAPASAASAAETRTKAREHTVSPAQRARAEHAASLRAPCDALPPPAHGQPWKPGERLSYDIDVMGARAGELVFEALPTVGKGSSKELPFRALAASNSFFSKVRRVRGRSTSYVRAKNLHPRRYVEASNEGGIAKSATVVFKRPSEGRLALVDWKKAGKTGHENLRYANDAFDPVSAVYYLRSMELTKGQHICFDSYGIRKLWRLRGEVVGLEEVKVPAGTYKAWHIQGVAIRTDNPRSAREIHIWISNGPRRLPIASLGVIDLGAVRAQLTDVGTGPHRSPATIATEAEGRVRP